MTRNPPDAAATVTIAAVVICMVGWWARGAIGRAWRNLCDWKFREWLVQYLYRRERKAKSLAQAVDLYFRHRRQVERDWKD